MNIFILDSDPVLAAQYQCDKHVVKMVLESAQILSTIVSGPYKPTHARHPCVIWAGSKAGNYNWLVEHALALCTEYTHRYGKVHKCEAVIREAITPSLPPGQSQFVLCMPVQYQCFSDPVKSYRDYYLGEKAGFAKWTNRDVPFWWTI